LRNLSAIRVEQVAAQLALGRSAAFEAVRNHQIPGRKLPNTDRWVIPEDVVARIEAYGLGELATAPSHQDRYQAHSPHNAAEISVDEDNRRGLPQLSGKADWQGDTAVEILRDETPNPLAKLECPQRRYLTVAELARKLGVDPKQIYYAVKRGTLGCRRFGRKIVFPPDVVERAVRACEKLR
jgi:excisionase family DNA binding protein